MANEILRFRQGLKADLPSTKTAGQLLFATYQDAKSGNTEGRVYYDKSSSQRIILSNDVDRARSLLSGETASTTANGAWTAEIDGVTSLYDGLTIAIKLNKGPNSIYNTLNVNQLGHKLVWDSYGVRLTTQHVIYDELIIVYRANVGSYTPPSGGSTPGTLTAGASYTDGWVVVNHGKSLQTDSITNGDALVFSDLSDSGRAKASELVFDGLTDTQALTKKGEWKDFSVVTLKVWEESP